MTSPAAHRGVWHASGVTKSGLHSATLKKSFALISKCLKATESLYLDDRRNAQRWQWHTNWRYRKINPDDWKVWCGCPWMLVDGIRLCFSLFLCSRTWNLMFVDSSLKIGEFCLKMAISQGGNSWFYGHRIPQNLWNPSESLESLRISGIPRNPSESLGIPPGRFFQIHCQSKGNHWKQPKAVKGHYRTKFSRGVTGRPITSWWPRTTFHEDTRLGYLSLEFVTHRHRQKRVTVDSAGGFVLRSQSTSPWIMLQKHLDRLFEDDDK